jgi:glycopeptide antibiotics resistance protein
VPLCGKLGALIFERMTPLKTLHRYIWLILALAVIATLFVSSSMTYKQQTAVPFLERVLANQPFKARLSTIHFTYAGDPVSVQASGYFAFVEFFIRKAAHVTTYFLIGLFASIGLREFVKPTWLRTTLTILSAAGLAAFDEFHQMLTGGRQPTFDDVMLDTIAATIAVVIVLLVSGLRRRKPVVRR